MGKSQKSKKEVLDHKILESVLIFLRTMCFAGAEKLLKDERLEITAQNHKILRSLGSLYSPQDKALRWIMDQGAYRENFPTIALCIFTRLGDLKEVKALLDNGAKMDEDPFRDNDMTNTNAVLSSITTDNVQCLQVLVSHPSCSKELLPKYLEESAKLTAPNCSLFIIDKIKEGDSVLKKAWKIWDEQLSFDPRVAKALVKKLNIKFLKDALKDANTDTKAILERELKTRELQGKFKQSLELI